MSAIHEQPKKIDSATSEQDDSTATVPSKASDEDEIGSPNDPVSDPKKPSSEA